MNHKEHGGDPNTRKCKKCNLVVRQSLWAAHFHYRHHNKAIPEGECKQCHYAGNKFDLKHHMSDHKKKNLYDCDLCHHDPFKFEKDLDNHRFNVHW